MGDTFRILQISDLHLFAEDTGSLLGINTQQTFQQVLQMAVNDSFKPDIIVLSGDLSQDMLPAAYENLANALKIFSCPIYWIPGNHDNFTTMSQVFAKSQLKSDKTILTPNGWQIVLLNSQKPGKVEGFLNAQELEHLKKGLSNSSYQHSLVMLHHHPIPVDCGWLEPIGLNNAEGFFAILSEFKERLRAVVFGHIHQEFEMEKEGIKYLAAPSTCIQFKPHCKEFTLDTERAPGYRCIELFSNGKINSWVRRIENFKPTYDLKAKGY